ncbi:MAG: V-type ATP synthase subunit B [bacterium]|nr:V-type ATP synthase subunit B [bacterium]MDT8396412.1 V-type ATP synthase subunit B [bacterium]
MTRKGRGLVGISGPLVSMPADPGTFLGQMLELTTGSGLRRQGQVLEISREKTTAQLFETTQGIDTASTWVRYLPRTARIRLSRRMLGRRFSGSGAPLDGMPPPVPEIETEITGSPINPMARDKPSDFIQTGISSIDLLNTLVRGQKLPIFSGSGLPSNELAVQIVRQASVVGEESDFAIVFAAMGITHRDASFFVDAFESTGAMNRTVVFLNLASDPTIERLLTPRMALSTAEHLAFEHGLHVLVVLTDMANYCEALREIGNAREEIPGRRGYPGYMYTDLAMIYERAGRIRGRAGSVTQIPILSMPDDDITHPIADLTGYITEGQIVLSRELHRKGIFPPIDVLPSLSRLMNLGIGEGKTRGDHRNLADQIYAFYARGRDLRRMEAVVGEDAMTSEDRRYLAFSKRFEEIFLHQGNKDRSIDQSLTGAWDLFAGFPEAELTRIDRRWIQEYFPGNGRDRDGAPQTEVDGGAVP